MHLIDAKCNNRIITSLFHFASTLVTQNVIKKSKCNNYYIITKRATTCVAKALFWETQINQQRAPYELNRSSVQSKSTF